MAEEDLSLHQTTERLFLDLLDLVDRCQREMVDLNPEEVFANCLSALSVLAGEGPAVLLAKTPDEKLRLQMATDTLPFSAHELERCVEDLDLESEAEIKARLLEQGGDRDVFVQVDARSPSVIALWSMEGESFDESITRGLSRLSESIRLVIQATVKFSDLLRLTALDGDTGLFTKGYFLSRLRSEIARASRYGHPLGLVFIDLDGFRLCAEAWGFEGTRRVIRRVANLLHPEDRSQGRFAFRRSDVPVRHGTGEFVVLLPETPKWGVLTKAERLRKAIAGVNVPLGGPEQLTASIGVAAFPEDASDATSLIESAMRAMLQAKRAGKNRVESA